MRAILPDKFNNAYHVFSESMMDQKIVINLLRLLFFIYLYSIFEFFSFLALSTFLISLNILLANEWNYCKQQGLIYYLPSSIQQVLTKSSILDVFTSLWSPKFFLYLKAFCEPFFRNISPEEAIKTLDDFPIETKNAILTKGIVYSLPNPLKRILLPEQIYEEICNNQKAAEKQKELERSENESLQDYEEVWGIGAKQREKKKELTRVIEEEELLQLTEDKESELEKIGRKSTLVNFKFAYLDNQLRFSHNPNYIHHHNNHHQHHQTLHLRNKEEKKMHNNLGSSQELKEPPTKLIASSSDLVSENKITSLNNFENVHSIFENMKNAVNGANADSTLGQIKNAFNLLLGVAEIKHKTELLSKIETSKIYKWFIFSAIFLLSQYFISRKTRRWLISSSMFAAYICSFFLTFGSMGLFIYKQVNNNQQSLPPSESSEHFPRSQKSKKKLQNKHEDHKFLIDDNSQVD